MMMLLLLNTDEPCITTGIDAAMGEEECSNISLNDAECQQVAQTHCDCCQGGLDVFDAFQDESFCMFFVNTRIGDCRNVFLQCCAGLGKTNYHCKE